MEQLVNSSFHTYINELDSRRTGLLNKIEELQVSFVNHDSNAVQEKIKELKDWIKHCGRPTMTENKSLIHAARLAA